jgi:hypothetical protein
VVTTSQNPKPLLGILQQRRIALVCSKAWHNKPLEDLTIALVGIVVNFIMQLTMHAQVHIEVVDTVKEQLLNYINMHTYMQSVRYGCSAHS